MVENCIKHNIVSQKNPLKIRVFAENDAVIVENALQRKDEKNTTGLGLKNIAERYRFFTTRDVRIRETTNTFAVTVPLLQTDI